MNVCVKWLGLPMLHDWLILDRPHGISEPEAIFLALYPVLVQIVPTFKGDFFVGVFFQLSDKKSIHIVSVGEKSLG